VIAARVWLLKSERTIVINDRVMLITYAARRTGRRSTIPVLYYEDCPLLWVYVGQPERKQWWRNLRDGGEVILDLRGHSLIGTARVEESVDGVRVVIEATDI